MSQEIDWTDTPSPIAAGSRPDLIRCGLGSLPPLIALNPRHVGVELHFWQGRSFPHLKEGCPACAAKNVATWKGYLGVWNPATRLSGILEFTLGCVSALDAHFLARGTCRGATLQIKRNGNKANGKLSLTVSTSQWGCDQLPATPDIRQQLSVMWGSKRLEEFISTQPGRAVAEAPATPAEVATHRANHAAAIDQAPPGQIEMPGAIAARLLAGKFGLINGNARQKEPTP